MYSTKTTEEIKLINSISERISTGNQEHLVGRAHSSDWLIHSFTMAVHENKIVVIGGGGGGAESQLPKWVC